MLVEHADAPLGIAEHHEILAEDARMHRGAVGLGHFLDESDRDPMAAHEAPHGRFALDTAQQVVVLVAEHLHTSPRPA